MNPFVAWNAVILRELFSPAVQGERVVLALGKDEMDDLAPELGGYEGLVGAVRTGPPWLPERSTRDLGHCAAVLKGQRRSLDRSPKYVDPSTLLPFGNEGDRMPTYLPILAVLVAIFREDTPGGFHGRARQALDLRAAWGPLELEAVNALWDDLAAWTTETEGRYGMFTNDQFGQQRHVGKLRAQCIFRSADIEKLAFAFAAARVKPAEPLMRDSAEKVLHAIRSDERFSVGLREAAGDREYETVLVQRMQDVLADWDGYVPRRTAAGPDVDTSDAAVARPPRELGIVLLPSDGGLPWRLGLRFPRTVDEGEVRLSAGACEWRARLQGLPEVTALPIANAEQSSDCLRLAYESLGGFMEFEAVADDVRRTFLLRHEMLRYLLADKIENALVERPSLPFYGGGHLLQSPDNAQLQMLLTNYGVSFEEERTEGLPLGWHLLYLPRCDQLEGVPLPDGHTTRPAARVLRLAGGVRIRRAGHTQFLPYDLPRVELDAPHGTTIDAPGLRLEEDAPAAPPSTALRGSALRTFSIEIVDHRIQRFTLNAQRPDGRSIGAVTLRVASAEEHRSAGTGTLGLDRWGGSTTAEPRVAGALLRGANVSHTVSVPVDQRDVGHSPSIDSVVSQLRENPAARFLDSLAMSQANQIPYGVARDRLRRYLDASGRDESVGAVLRDLRRRGIVEIDTDRRGRWTAVAKVPATVYSLPAKVDGRPVWGVCGTLSFHEWRSLVSATDFRFQGSSRGTLPTIRLVEMPQTDDLAAFHRVEHPSQSIADLSCTVDELRALLAEHGREHLDDRASAHVESFRPLLAQWLQGAAPGDPPSWTLLRYLDPETGAHRLHSLRSTISGLRYRHIRDERWGTWIAYAATIQWLRECLAFPFEGWPLHYAGPEGHLWLPARMNLPYLLERAVVTASGGAPDEFSLRRDPEPGELWGITGLGTRIGPFDPCYENLLPDAEERLWLRYRWVPRQLVQTIASKLGCRVVEM